MSAVLEKVTREIGDRVARLEPMVQEHKRLAAALQALRQLDGARAPTRAPHRRARRVTQAKPKAPPRARARRTSAAGTAGANATRSAQVLEQVERQPGITVTELATKLGMNRTYLYRVVPALQRAGKIRKDGRGLHTTEKG